MALNILELPREMIAEVVKHVDYNGLLSLRRTCTLTKEIADEEAFKVSSIRRILFHEGFVRVTDGADFRIKLCNSKPALFLLPYKEITKRWTNGIIQIFDFKIPKEEFSEFLLQFRENLPTFEIESFDFESKSEFYISLFESFLEDLTIAEKCLSAYAYYNDKEWDVAYQTIKRLHLNTAKMGVHQYVRYGDKMVMADAVDGLILTRDFHEHIKDPISLAVSILSRKCYHLEMPCSWLSEDQVNEAVHKLPLLGKEVYLATKLSKGVPRRKFAVGSMNVELDIETSTGEMEIWYDGMRRKSQ